MSFREQGDDCSAAGTGNAVEGAKEKQNARASRDMSRKNTRLDCADCCACVAVEGGQVHEDAGWLEAGPRAAGRLETKKAGCFIRRSWQELKRRNDRRAFLYIKLFDSAWNAQRATMKRNVNEGELLFERRT
ncbi:hypothetical protein PQQ73_28855 [Paraburkholderia strydomiana]|uniref:Uncharacterized protein n=1 Tax=Paraburkholderia strydomiana TaxID=1245417 RepID=A0ABW9EMK7_9BURK